MSPPPTRIAQLSKICAVLHRTANRRKQWPQPPTLQFWRRQTAPFLTSIRTRSAHGVGTNAPRRRRAAGTVDPGQEQERRMPGRSESQTPTRSPWQGHLPLRPLRSSSPSPRSARTHPSPRLESAPGTMRERNPDAPASFPTGLDQSAGRRCAVPSCSANPNGRCLNLVDRFRYPCAWQPRLRHSRISFRPGHRRSGMGSVRSVLTAFPLHLALRPAVFGLVRTVFCPCGPATCRQRYGVFVSAPIVRRRLKWCAPVACRFGGGSGGGLST